jgi:hypothetical protein
MLYRQLSRFLLPLVVTMVAHGLGMQVLNGGMARVPRATETLAAFALAWGIADFLASPLSPARQLSLVLAQDTRSFGRSLLFVLAWGGGLAILVTALAATSLGAWVIGDLHSAPESLAKVVRFALMWLVPYPLIEGLRRLLSGVLLRVRRTEVVSVATMAGIGVSIAAVVVLLPTPFVQRQPIWLPLIALYGALLVDLAILWWGYRRYARPRLRQKPVGQQLSVVYMTRFFWPLALIMAIQGMSRPAVNLFISRGPQGEEALAVLAVVYTLGHIPYGWLNELRSLPTAFQEEGGDGLRQIRRFSFICGLASFVIMIILFWIGPVREFILQDLVGLESDLTARCRLPLMIFTFFPLVVAPRSFFHGTALLQRRTRSLAPSAPSRIGATLVVLMALPPAAMHGAARGIAALYCGFVMELVAVWWFVRQGRSR